MDIKDKPITDLTNESILAIRNSSSGEKVKDIPPKKIEDVEVYASMQHQYPPIKIFNMKTDYLENIPIFTPSRHGKHHNESRYRGVSIMSFNHLIDDVNTLYFKMSGDLFSLLGPNYGDETSLRMYGVNDEKKTFIILLREALSEYADIDSKQLYTCYKWLERENRVYETNRSSIKYLYKYKFIPNWIDWIKGDPNVTEDKVILPFRLITGTENFIGFNRSSRFVQNASAQTFYSYLQGDALCSYYCEYPFLYSINPDGSFSDASAIFELKDPKFFELIFARTIAYYVKRNLDVIQLPGNVVNYNFEGLIQELNDKIQGLSELANAETLSGLWNPYNNTKF